MPPSLDDDSFMRTCMGDIGMEEEVEDGDGMEEEVEDVENSRRPSGRQANYTVDEDEALCLAWEAVTLDVVNGVMQTNGTYWQRIRHYYDFIKKGGGDQSQGSLTHRWQIIQGECSRWAAALEQVERLNPSGTNPQDRINLAQQFYKQSNKKKNGEPGKAFGLQHCWVLLDHDEKWRTRGNELPTKKSKSSDSSSSNIELVDSSDEFEGDGAGRSTTPSSGAANKRPNGRKAEKEKLKKAGESTYKEALDNMVATRKELAAERKEENNQKWLELKEMEAQRIAIEERRAALAEQRA